MRTTLFFLLLLLLSSPYSAAQFLPEGTRTFPGEELFRTSGGGFLGIARDGDVTHLTGYLGTFEFVGTRAYRPLQVLDVAPLDRGSAGSVGVLLGHSKAGMTLYFITQSQGSPPALAPIREGDLPRVDRIIHAGPLADGGVGRLALAGDTTFLVLDTEGHTLYSIDRSVVDAILDPTPPARFILALRTSAGTELQWIDAAGGRVLARRRIESSGALRLHLLRQLVAISSTPPYLATIIDRASTQVIDTARLPSRALAVFDRSEGEEHRPVAILGGYPAPLLAPLLSPDGEEAAPFGYPLNGTIDAAVVGGGLVALVSGDSLAMFDMDMNLQGRTSTMVAGGAMRLTPLDSTAILLSSRSGSQLLQLRRSMPGWIERHWRQIAIGVVAALLLGLAIAALRRYLFVRSIYNNLVGGRGSGGILVMTGSQRVRHINAAARRMLDVAGYIPMGRHVREYLTDDDFRPVIESLRKLFSSSVPFELRIDKTMAVGSRSYSFRGRPMFGRYGFTAGFLLLVDDVTETIAQERLVNWASVAHHIAHEMKTPLGTVRVTAEMLRDRLGSNGGDHDELRATTRIIRQSERLRSIVDDLLTVARTESLRKIGADLGLLLPSLTSDYLEYLPPGVELKLTIEGDDFHCHIDVAQVTVALRNLLDNARHAIGGHAGGRIDLAMRSDDSMITITVADNGVGMGPETLAKLFQPFYTEREGGSGIGTIIIKRVIEGHGGTIDVSSKVGVGTVFTVTLPRG